MDAKSTVLAYIWGRMERDQKKYERVGVRLTGASETDKGAKGNGGPSRRLTGAVSAGRVLWLFQKCLQLTDLRLQRLI